jgi:hypothetical protein
VFLNVEWIAVRLFSQPRHMERAIIAGRVSTKDQADKGFSLPEQISAGRDYVAHSRYELASVRGFSNVGEVQPEVETDRENKESLRGRKAQRTKERQDYERERAEIVEQLSYQSHSDEQLADIYAHCARYRDRLSTATPEQQRELLVLFEVQGRLAIEDGYKVAHVTCKLGAERFEFGSKFSYLCVFALKTFALNGLSCVKRLISRYAAASAASTRSGVIGCWVSQAPVASWMAAAIAGASDTSAISDMPRAPYGPLGSASSMITGTISVGISSTVGSR